MIYVDILEYLHGQQPFENVLEDVLEDVFGLAPPGPRLMVAMGHMLWAIQWAVHEYLRDSKGSESKQIVKSVCA